MAIENNEKSKKKKMNCFENNENLKLLLLNTKIFLTFSKAQLSRKKLSDRM